LYLIFAAKRYTNYPHLEKRHPLIKKLLLSVFLFESLKLLSLNVSFLMHFFILKSKIQAQQSFPDETSKDFPGDISI
jgi:hypothetical protein